MTSRLRPSLTLLDLIIIALPLLVACALFQQGAAGVPASLCIKTPEKIWRQSLPAQKTIRLQGKLGVFEVRLNGEQVSIHETHCPGQVCQRMGPIERSGQRMICVPQEIEVWLEGGEAEVDAVCR